MVNRVRRQFRHLFRQAHTVNHEPVNRASLAVIILIDLFILFNLFSGLSDISRWPLSPDQAYPCQSTWAGYRRQTEGNRDYDMLRHTIRFIDEPAFSWATDYRARAEGHLGQVSGQCLEPYLSYCRHCGAHQELSA